MVSVEEHCVLYEVRILCKAISSMTVSFREMVARVRPGTEHTWMPHHATSHFTRQSPSTNFWQKGNILVVPQPPYSPDLSLSDFFYFPGSKITWKATSRKLGSYPEERNRQAEWYSSRSLPALLRTMETTPPSLCSCPRELFWRR